GPRLEPDPHPSVLLRGDALEVLVRWSLEAPGIVRRAGSRGGKLRPFARLEPSVRESSRLVRVKERIAELGELGLALSPQREESAGRRERQPMTLGGPQEQRLARRERLRRWNRRPRRRNVELGGEKVPLEADRPVGGVAQLDPRAA